MIVRDLLDRGADVNAPGKNGTFPLHDVIESGSMDIVNMLFSHGAYINAFEPYYYQTPLMWACQSGAFEIVRSYLLQGANVAAKDANSWTAVHYATYSNSQEIFDELRTADANFDTVNSEGNTPLHVAVLNQSVQFVRALLEGCAYPSIQVHIRPRNIN